jgi:uncharacterized membrane protein
MSQPTVARSPRIHFLDEVRGFDILLMVLFHGFYTVGWLLDLSIGRTLFLFFMPVEPFFAGIFIFICGISCYLSHSNWRRGALLALIAVGISLVMYVFMRDQMIWFGILHMLAVCILLFALLRPLLEKIPFWVGVVACIVLFTLTYPIPNYGDGLQHGVFGIRGLFTVALPESVTQNVWLYPLGFGRAPSPASDYFPVFPWLFCFLCGSFIGRLAKQQRFPQWMYRSHVPFFSWCGKHTLAIYILHQPIIYGVGLLLQMVLQ